MNVFVSTSSVVVALFAVMLVAASCQSRSVEEVGPPVDVAVHVSWETFSSEDAWLPLSVEESFLAVARPRQLTLGATPWTQDALQAALSSSAVRESLVRLRILGSVDDGLLREVYRFPRLLHVDLKEARGLTRAGIAHLCRSASLRWVTLPRSCGGEADAMLATLRPMRELTVLSLPSEAHSSRGLMMHLPAFRNLEVLRLDAPGDAYNERVAATTISRLHSLRHLHVEGAPVFNPHADPLPEPCLDAQPIPELDALTEREQGPYVTLEWPPRDPMEWSGQILQADEAPSEVVVIDVGSEDNVHPGQRLTIFHADRHEYKGNAVIVRVTETTSIARLEGPYRKVTFAEGDFVRRSRLFMRAISTVDLDALDALVAKRSDLAGELRIQRELLEELDHERAKVAAEYLRLTDPLRRDIKELEAKLAKLQATLRPDNPRRLQVERMLQALREERDEAEDGTPQPDQYHQAAAAKWKLDDLDARIRACEERITALTERMARIDTEIRAKHLRTQQLEQQPFGLEYYPPGGMPQSVPLRVVPKE